MPIFRILFRSLFSFLLLLTLLPCRAAEQQDRFAPIYFQTDRWVYDDLKQINTLTGHVVLNKGTILIKADQITVQRDPEGYQYIKASTNGGPRAYFRQKRYGFNEYIEGRGKTITYDDKSEIATMRGRAHVLRLQGLTKVLDEVQGSVIRYDHAHNIYSADSGNDIANQANPHGRVRAMISSPNKTPAHIHPKPQGDNAISLTPSTNITPLTPHPSLNPSAIQP